MDALEGCLIVVLYRVEDGRWKITDFGLTSEGTSRRAHTTRYARGTSSYRAPELLSESTCGYNNKVDIWALGCIAYELIARKQAFAGDHSVLQYSLSGGVPQLSLPAFSDNWIPMVRYILSNLIHALLVVDGATRPSTKNILHALQLAHFKVPVALQLISSCGQLQPDPLSNPEDIRLHSISMVLGNDSQHWNSVRWKRYWYLPIMIKMPTDLAQSAQTVASPKIIYSFSRRRHVCQFIRKISPGNFS